MRFSRALIGATLAALLASGCAPAGRSAIDASTAHATTVDLKPSPSKRPVPRSTGTGLMTLDGGDLDHTTVTGRSYIVMQPWEADRIPALRKASPGLIVLMYKNVASVRKDTSDSGMSSTGLTYAEVQNTNPAWFLHDRDGTVLEWSDWPGLYPVNVAARGYQDRWLKNVVRDLRRGDWDGVMADDALARLSHSTFGNRVSPTIPDDASMRAATGSFLARVGPRLKRRGYQVFPNLTDVEWDGWKPLMSKWNRYVSGWENEYFVKWGLDSSSPRFRVDVDWTWKTDMARWLARLNIPLLAVTYSNRADTATQIYHRATWLLTWNGRTGAGIFVPAETGVNNSTRLANLDLGKPRGAEHVTDEVHWRRYSKGMALVNPTMQARIVRLDRPYRKTNGHRVRSVRLAPLTGALLLSR